MNPYWSASENNGQENWRELNAPERLALMEHIRLVYPRLQLLLQRMNQCAQNVAEASQDLIRSPLHVAVAGQARIGKTILAEMWFTEVTRKIQAKEAKSSTLYHYIRLPEMITRKGLLSYLLSTATGFCSDHLFRVSTTWNMERLLFQALAASGVHLFILDNCEYLIRRPSMYTDSFLLELLVSMTYQSHLSLILLGESTAMEHIMEAFPKFERHHLAPFGWDRAHPETVMEWQTLLTALDHELPFDESVLTIEEVAYRLFYATEGILGRLMHLLYVAAEKAIHEASTTLSLCDLAFAYNSCIAGTSMGRGKVNPFSASDFTEMGA